MGIGKILERTSKRETYVSIAVISVFTSKKGKA